MAGRESTGRGGGRLGEGRRAGRVVLKLFLGSEYA